MARVTDNFPPETRINNDRDRITLESVPRYKRELENILEEEKNAKKALEKRKADLEAAKEKLRKAQKEKDEVEIKNIESRIDSLNDIIVSGEEHQNKLSEKQEQLKNKIQHYTEELENRYNIDIEAYEESISLASDVQTKLELLKEERRQVLSDNSLSGKERRERLRDIENREKSEENILRKSRGENSLEYDAFVESLGGKDSTFGSIVSRLPEEAIQNMVGGIKDITSILGIATPEISSIVNIVKGIGSTVKFISEGIMALRSSMTRSIENAAKQMSSYYGPIKANLEGSQYSWDSITTDVDRALGLNRYVKQTDYLSKISELTSAGYINDIEQRAILETIKNKTLTSFDVRDAALTRLIRLGEQDSMKQFGIELQLKRLLNKPVFGDASYLQGLFDSVSSAILDAGVATNSDITNFNSTVQTYLGAMYASGLSDNLVNSIAQGINSLGSGNVQALSQDENIQRLFLLSMDRIQMDYADILQQGLSSDDASKLLASMIEYLAKIAENTSDNLVLKSSYSNLFNMSMADMQAIQNVSKEVSTISSSIINQNEASQLTRQAVSTVVADNTLASEQFENFFDNFSYSFGSNIAEDSKSYTIYRIADMTYNMLDRLSNVGGKLGKAISYAKIAPVAVQYYLGLKGFLPMLTELSSSAEEGSLVSLLDSETTSTTSTVQRSKGDGLVNSIKRLTKGSSVIAKIGDLSTASDDWDEVDADVVDILKEMSKTLMKLKEDEGYAFAVSLEGMNDSVLKSFASIFADEDAMLATFQGDNTVLTEALFEYAGDTTSNSG